jgi:hypothetical protein
MLEHDKYGVVSTYINMRSGLLKRSNPDDSSIHVIMYNLKQTVKCSHSCHFAVPAIAAFRPH